MSKEPLKILSPQEMWMGFIRTRYGNHKNTKSYIQKWDQKIQITKSVYTKTTNPKPRCSMGWESEYLPTFPHECLAIFDPLWVKNPQGLVFSRMKLHLVHLHDKGMYNFPHVLHGVDVFPRVWSASGLQCLVCDGGIVVGTRRGFRARLLFTRWAMKKSLVGCFI